MLPVVHMCVESIRQNLGWCVSVCETHVQLSASEVNKKAQAWLQMSEIVCFQLFSQNLQLKVRNSSPLLDLDNHRRR